MLLMDEPLGALDALTRSKLMRLIDQVWRETQTTVVYVTHNVSEAVFLADRVVVLKANPGEIVRDFMIAPPRPRNPLSQAIVDWNAASMMRCLNLTLTKSHHKIPPAEAGTLAGATVDA